jgi:hypothetical protein
MLRIPGPFLPTASCVLQTTAHWKARWELFFTTVSAEVFSALRNTCIVRQL